MFWGLNLKPNRKYTQTSTKAFHISGAALDSESSSGGATQIFLSSDNQKFLQCTLRKGGPEQVMLDLNFGVGEEICFQSIGSGNVSLSGYIIDGMMGGESDSDDEDFEMSQNDIEDLRNALNKKQKKKPVKGAAADEEDEDDDESDDPDFNGLADGDGDDSDAEVSGDEEDADDDDDDDEEAEDDDDDDEEDEEESEEEEVQAPKAKQPKLDKQAAKQNGNAASAGKPEKKDKKNKESPTAGQQQQKKESNVGVERTITGGVKVVDLREGQGPEAKVGKRAQVYYEGRLKSNNKVFDSMKSGAGFKFPLGRGEVIKAWDVGVVGMKVGGKRRIICPPHMAYGARGSPPTIPPNSTLVFEVELKGVN